MEHSPFIFPALNFKIREEVKILPQDQREDFTSREISSAINRAVLPHGLKLQDNVSCVEKNKVYIAKAGAGKVSQNV